MLWLSLATLSVAGGYLLILRLSRARGLDPALAAEMTVAMLAAGFAGAHLFRVLYFPDLLLTSLLTTNRAGLASFGGLFAGLAAGMAWLRCRAQSVETALRYLDVVAFAFPFAWMVARTGCFLVGDHPGAFTTSWLGVRYPDGLRYDLGLIEVFFTAALALLFLGLRRWNYPPGFYPGLLFSLYAPFRFLLDRLHVDPPRYLGWSVDQLSSMAAGVIGLLFLIDCARRSAITPAARRIEGVS